MKARNLKDYSGNWVQTVVSIIGLLFVILVSLNVITPEQSTQAQSIFSTTLGAVSTVITGVIALIGIFFKNSQ
jgi:hypothetical protein